MNNLELLLKDFHKEAENLAILGGGTLRYTVKGFIWDICRHFHINYGVAGNACKILEKYIASIVRSHSTNEWIDPVDIVMSIVSPRLPIIAACCVLLAAKSESRASVVPIHRDPVSPHTIRNYLLNLGVLEYSTTSIRIMERKIFKKIGFQVPIYTSMDMAGILAAELALPLPTLLLAVTIVEAAELHRHNIQSTLLYLAYRKQSSCYNCVMTLHLAASSVITAALIDLDRMKTNWVTDRLAALLKTCKDYLRTLSQVILLEVKDINSIL